MSARLESLLLERLLVLMLWLSRHSCNKSRHPESNQGPSDHCKRSTVRCSANWAMTGLIDQNANITYQANKTPKNSLQPSWEPNLIISQNLDGGVLIYVVCCRQPSSFSISGCQCVTTLVLHTCAHGWVDLLARQSWMSSDYKKKNIVCSRRSKCTSARVA